MDDTIIHSSSHLDSAQSVGPPKTADLPSSPKLTDVQSRSSVASSGVFTQKLKAQEKTPVLPISFVQRQETQLKKLQYQIRVASNAAKFVFEKDIPGILSPKDLAKNQETVRQSITNIAGRFKTMGTLLSNATGISSLKDRTSLFSGESLATTEGVQKALEELGRVADDFQSGLNYLTQHAKDIPGPPKEEDFDEEPPPPPPDEIEDIPPPPLPEDEVDDKIASSSVKPQKKQDKSEAVSVESSSPQTSVMKKLDEIETRPRALSGSAEQVKTEPQKIIGKMEDLTKTRFGFYLLVRSTKKFNLNPEDSRFVHMVANQLVKGKPVYDSVRRKIKYELAAELAGRSSSERVAIKTAFAEKFGWPDAPLSEFSQVVMDRAKEIPMPTPELIEREKGEINALIHLAEEMPMPPLSFAMKRELREIVDHSLEGRSSSDKSAYKSKLITTITSSANKAVNEMAGILRNAQNKIAEQTAKIERLKASENPVDQEEIPAVKGMLIKDIKTYEDLLSTSHQYIMERTISLYAKNVNLGDKYVRDGEVATYVQTQADRDRRSYATDKALIPLHQLLKRLMEDKDPTLFIERAYVYSELLKPKASGNPTKSLVESYTAETALIQSAYGKKSKETMKASVSSYDTANASYNQALQDFNAISLESLKSESLDTLADKVKDLDLVKIKAERQKLSVKLEEVNAAIKNREKTDGVPSVLEKRIEEMNVQISLMEGLEKARKSPQDERLKDEFVNALHTYIKNKSLGTVMYTVRDLQREFKKAEDLYKIVEEGTKSAYSKKISEMRQVIKSINPSHKPADILR